jgi:hypothetical protein
MATEYKTLAGLTLSAPGRPSFLLTVISVKLPSTASQEIADNDLSSTVAKSFAGAVVDYGEVSGTARFKPGLTIPVAQPDEPWLLSFPLVGVQSTAGRFDFIGHFTKADMPEATTDNRAEVAFTIKVNSRPVFTEGA